MYVYMYATCEEILKMNHLSYELQKKGFFFEFSAQLLISVKIHLFIL